MIFEIKKIAQAVDHHLETAELGYVDPASVRIVLYALEQMGYIVEPDYILRMMIEQCPSQSTKP